MKSILIKCFALFILFSCNKKEKEQPYKVSGRVINSFGAGVKDVEIRYGDGKYVLTDEQGNWVIADLTGKQTLMPIAAQYTFSPAYAEVKTPIAGVNFQATRTLSEKEIKIFNWFNSQQLPNGLLESAENGNVVSLYDNALAAMVFMLKGDFAKAEKIFDFFNSRVNSELNSGVGGFSQLRDRNGVPNNHRWMGDNAWLLIAINNYKHLTGNTTYDQMAARLSSWLIQLQDADGGLYAGYNAANNLLNYKVTEGIIDAFNAIDGYTIFHQELLKFLKDDRWDATDKNLVSWPTNPPYLYALDLHPWSYLIFQNYPVSSLTTAQRYLTTKTATVGAQITGYCFDEDKDVVWLEGTGQMALAFGRAYMPVEKDYYLQEMEKVWIQSMAIPDAGGFAYASNPGTAYATDLLWQGADTKIAISGGAWYLFATFNFNPFAVGRKSNIPNADMFWVE